MIFSENLEVFVWYDIFTVVQRGFNICCTVIMFKIGLDVKKYVININNHDYFKCIFYRCLQNEARELEIQFKNCDLAPELPHDNSNKDYENLGYKNNQTNENTDSNKEFCFNPIESNKIIKEKSSFYSTTDYKPNEIKEENDNNNYKSNEKQANKLSEYSNYNYNDNNSLENNTNLDYINKNNMKIGLINDSNHSSITTSSENAEALKKEIANKSNHNNASNSNSNSENISYQNKLSVNNFLDIFEDQDVKKSFKKTKSFNEIYIRTRM